MELTIVRDNKYLFFYEKIPSIILLLILFYQQITNIIFCLNLTVVPNIEYILDFIVMTSLMFPICIILRNINCEIKITKKMLNFFYCKYINIYFYKYVRSGIYLNIIIIVVIFGLGFFYKEVVLFKYSWLFDIFTFIGLIYILLTMEYITETD